MARNFPLCTDCNIRLKDYRSSKCRKCLAKVRSVIWKGLRRSPKTEFKKGIVPWHKGKKVLQVSGENHWNWKGGAPKCLECGKETNKGSYKAKYCFEYKGIPIKGEKNYRWKGGTGTIRHQEMGRFEYRLWRQAVFARDNWTCQSCNARDGRYLEADHIKPWALYPELRYAIDNGRTLCRECHRQTDTWGIRISLKKEVD